MVGHTHEDIDQVFSRVATHMGRNDAHTLTELLNCITKSTTPEPDVVHLKSIFDYKEVLMNARGLIEGITGPHVFRFAEEDGNIIMAYKDWPTSEEVYRKLNVSNCVISSLAHLENTKCNPKIEETLARMSNDISKWAESGRLEKEEVLWWKAYLSSCKQEVRLRPEVPRATVLGTFLCHAPPLATGMDNLRLAVEKNVSKEKRTSLLRLKRR